MRCLSSLTIDSRRTVFFNELHLQNAGISEVGFQIEMDHDRFDLAWRFFLPLLIEDKMVEDAGGLCFRNNDEYFSFLLAFSWDRTELELMDFLSPKKLHFLLPFS